MSTTEKRKISEVKLKKTDAPNRLIKCYICNLHFNTQLEFDRHSKEHQNKLNRTNRDDWKRKTQDQFPSKKQPSALVKTISAKRDLAKTIQMQDRQKKQKSKIEDKQQLDNQESAENLLRQSQIILQKLQFLTSIPEPQIQIIESPQVEQEDEKISIENEEILYNMFCEVNQKFSGQILILRTKFQQQYFQNYQQQLKHLKKLQKMAINSDSIIKIQSTIKRIVKDVLLQLQYKYSHKKRQFLSKKQQRQIIHSTENKGQVAYCSSCYMEIEVGSSFLHSQLGTIYHQECYEQ